MPDAVSTWAVGVLLLFAQGVLAYLLRRSFEELAGAVKELGSKVDALKSAQAEQDGDVRVLAQRVDQLEKAIERLEALRTGEHQVAR